jgi:phosphoglycerate dehydrogenase-like enzyme
LLTGQSVLILGFGSIARRLVELLAPFRMNTIALRRSPSSDEPIAVHSIDKADALLPSADHVVNILPQSAQTERFFSADRFARLKPGAVFYNIGRGTTVDQTALAATLRSGKLSAAYLDVTDPEPLPAAHELWTTPHCHITPHTAGGFDGEFDRQVEFFLENFKRFTRGEPLLDRVF